MVLPRVRATGAQGSVNARLCEEGGVWYALMPSADQARVDLLRIPAIAEMGKALSRQDGGNPG